MQKSFNGDLLQCQRPEIPRTVRRRFLDFSGANLVGVSVCPSDPDAVFHDLSKTKSLERNAPLAPHACAGGIRKPGL
ncbi:hypothetical protein PZA11_000792 [Diplocarpon coronariae]